MNNTTLLFLAKRIRTLPVPIQEYLKNALFLIDDDDTGADYMIHKPISIAESLRLEQEGDFLMNGKWLPFRATEYISASQANPGFLWDAEVSIFPKQQQQRHMFRNLKISVRDYYSDGKGAIEADMMRGIIPVRLARSGAGDDDGDGGMNSAELMRWFSEMVLHPTSFLPHSGNAIHWNEDAHPLEGPWPLKEGSRARGRIIDPNSEEETEVEFYFDDKGLISSARGYRRMRQNGRMLPAPWECRFGDYQVVDGMTIPLSIEAGWWSEDGNKFDVYFKGRNLRFDYKFY